MAEAGALPRVDLVDHWHRDWPQVRASVERALGVQHMAGEHEGWLSARQSLLVAYLGDHIVGHVSFHVEPAPRSGPYEPARAQARLDSLSVDPEFGQSGIEEALRQAAVVRAEKLSCPTIMGL